MRRPFGRRASDVSAQFPGLELSVGVFGELIETAPDALVIVDGGGRIVLVNAQTERMFACKRAELLGQPVEVLMPDRFRGRHAGHRTGYFQSPRTRAMGAGLQLYGRRRDGTEFPVEITLSPLKTSEGVLVSSTIRDVTAGKRAEAELAARVEELARSNAELEQFVYVASHDLQEPLRTVMSYTQLLARRFGGTEVKDADEFVGYITDAVTQMKTLIEGLLAFSRVTRQEHEFKSADLNRALGRALANLGEPIKTSGARVTHEPLPTLRADAQLLTQLFQNLVGNAVKFRGQEPPEVQVSAERKDTEWVISVRDNGIGIEPRHRDQIFVLFKRLHTRDHYPGSGIGLAVCKKIVHFHGGRIWVEPGHPGSVFRFTLPAG